MTRPSVIPENTRRSTESQKGKNPGPACPSTQVAPTCHACTMTATAKRMNPSAIRICALRMRPLFLQQQVTLRHQLLVQRLRFRQPFLEFRPGHELALEGIVGKVSLP